MLYPIELLRHKSTTRTVVRGTACMLTTYPGFVMSSLFFKCRQMVLLGRLTTPSGWPRAAIHLPLACLS